MLGEHLKELSGRAGWRSWEYKTWTELCLVFISSFFKSEWHVDPTTHSQIVVEFVLLKT